MLIARHHRIHGGSTTDLAGNPVTYGYAVAHPKFTEQHGRVEEKQLHSFLSRYVVDLQSQRLVVGTWRPGNGRPEEISGVQIVANPERAQELAETWRQVAFQELGAHGRTIPVG